MWYRFLHCSRLGLNRHYVIWYAVVKFVGVCVCASAAATAQTKAIEWTSERVSVAFNCVAESAIMQWRIFDIPLWICTSTIEFHFFSYKILFRFYFVHCFLLYHFNGRRSKVEQAMAGKSWMQLSFIYRPIAGWFFAIAVVLYATVMLATRNKSKNQKRYRIYNIILNGKICVLLLFI